MDFITLAISKNYTEDTALGMGAVQGQPGRDGQDGQDGVGMPAGGTAGQVLVKNSEADFDTGWSDPNTGGGGTSEKEYEKYIVFCVAGQSNAVGYDESPVDLKFTYKNRDPKRIKQLGYYDADNLEMISLGHCAQNLQDMRTKSDGNPIQDINGVRGTKGIHLPLANLMIDYIPDDYGVLVVPAAYGSTGFLSGNEGTYNQDTKKPNNYNSLKWSPTSALYQTMKGRIIHALELNRENLFAGVIWCQGEKDKGSASGHKTAFEAMTTAFFAEMNDYDGGNLRNRVPKGEWDRDIWYNLETVTYWDYQEQCKSIWENYKTWNKNTYIDIPRDTDSNLVNGTGDTSSTYASHYGNNAYYKVIAPRVLQKMIEMNTFNKKLEAVDDSEYYKNYASDLPEQKTVTNTDVTINKINDTFTITVADGSCTVSQDITSDLFAAEKPVILFNDTYKLEWKVTRGLYWLIIEGNDANDCVVIGLGGTSSHQVARIINGTVSVIVNARNVYPGDAYTFSENDRVRVYRNKDRTVSVYRTDSGNGIFQKWFDCDITNYGEIKGFGFTFGISSGETAAPFNTDKTTVFSEMSFQQKECEISNKLFDFVVGDLKRRIAALESPTT